MPCAVAVGLPGRQVFASLRGYQSHCSHAGERIWPEANFFHLLAATPYSVWPQLSEVASVDSLGTATITVRA
jgi:hypothetical protein